MFDVNALLEFIHTNKDVNVQVKLFSTLSAYIMSKKVNIDEIITYNSLYDKICKLLSNCRPGKTSVLLNFLSALLYAIDEDDKTNSLLVYAKNMIRSSGCLATMCEFFTNGMMHQDAWQALCRCLAETCHNMETNQSYCTHLVPTCVQRCSQRNIEVLLVLQSLLSNHARNVNLFIKCNGMTLFRRDMLQHGICLQLLNTLVQSSEQTVELITKSDITQNLLDFLRLYGPDSQLGKWATIILYHISGTKGTCFIPMSYQYITDMKNKSMGDDLQNTTDTTRFFQNVVKEIGQCGLLPAKSQCKNRENLFVRSTLSHNQLPKEIWPQNISSTFNNRNLQKFITKSNGLVEGKHNERRDDLSFSFLYKENNKRYTNASMTANKMTNTLRTAVSTSVNVRKFSDLYERPKDSFICHDTPELSSFAPKFVSTPKKHDSLGTKKSTMRYVKNSTLFSNSIDKHKQKRDIQSRKYLSTVTKFPKRLEQTTCDRENKHRSISGWFFEAVNESCTALVKSVKNIFSSKHHLKESKAKSITPNLSQNSRKSCSYSFTNYMRKRDAILKSECTMGYNIDSDDFSVEMSNSCSSCNDTVVLKHKLANDEYLKQTVRKLKLGINLYGCDFKKISKQLWPQQSYMTPVVLYNLYRKLIIK